MARKPTAYQTNPRFDVIKRKERTDEIHPTAHHLQASRNSSGEMRYTLWMALCCYAGPSIMEKV